MHIGDVNLLTGVPVRTQYRMQVQRIAPPCLVGRERELAELTDFCTSPATEGAYQWWRAKAWTGKSALLSWFVLNPPAGVRLVSFFVTARLSSQNDRPAFIDNLLEQLVTVMGQDLPPFLTEATREAHLLGLLNDAAELCRERGECLVLLVDGLDEDRSLTIGADAHSIAALLPVSPPAGMRVIVAGRPDPPIPADVPSHHPLRDPAIVRSLTPSPQAQVVRADMERELKNLLYGTAADQDLLGLVTAAGGGLTAADLAELTGRSSWEIDDHLRTVTGRTFTRRDGYYVDGVEVYLLGHEEIQVTAQDVLGPARLATYRQRLHDWADTYRTRRWPQDTPEYLLRGYYNMLAAAGDLPRMIACATEPARHDRMLDLSGGDAAALAEITTTHDILTRDRPDISAMARLAIHRDHLVDRNTFIPTNLPAVWVDLRNPNRAEALARSIPDHTRQSKALTAVAERMAATGDLDRAMGMVDRAISLAREISDSIQQNEALMAAPPVLATMGELDRAIALAESIPGPYQRSSALTQVAEVMARAGELDRAEELAAGIAYADQRGLALTAVAIGMASNGAVERAHTLIENAEVTARAITHSGQQSRAFAVLAVAVAQLGDQDRAAGLINTADALARRDFDASHRSRAVGALARALADAGHVEEARSLIGDIEFAEPRSWAVGALACALARAGQLDEAETTTDSIVQAEQRSQVLTAVAAAMAQTGERDRATRVITRAEVLARTIRHADQQNRALRSVAQALANVRDLERMVGLVDRVERLARSITDPFQQNWALRSLVHAMAKAGELDRTERLARSIEDDEQQSWALTSVAGAMAKAGELGRAEVLSRSIAHTKQQSWGLTWVAGAMGKAGLPDRATALARSIGDTEARTEAMTAVAQSLSDSGDHDRALAMIDEAKAVAKTLHSNDKNPILQRVAHTLVKIGEIDMAEKLASGLTMNDHGQALTAVGQALIHDGEVDRAIQIIRKAASGALKIEYVREKDRALVEIVQIMAKAGQYDEARELVGSIASSYSWCRAVVDLAAAMNQAGDYDNAARTLDEAESFASSIADPRWKSQVLVPLATCHDTLRAERAIARILTLSRWHTPLQAIAQTQPDALSEIVDELIKMSE